jgi:Domain of unknown function (DUF4112)
MHSPGASASRTRRAAGPDPRAAGRTAAVLAAERRIAWIARLLDDLVAVPGTNARVGLDPVIGLIPVVGDLVAAVIGAWIVLEAARFRVPGIVMVRMILNTFVDFVIGLIPFVGDILDFGFKGNRMNLELFHRYALDPAEDTSGHWAFVLGLVAVLVGLAWLGLLLAARMLSLVAGVLA